jgi:hypothetical protein
MLEQYLEEDIRRFGYFFGLVIGAVIVVTMIYWLVFGFDRWSGEMQRASDLMMAATASPIGQAYTSPPVAGQYVCPRDGGVGLPNFDAAGVPHCPVCGQVMNFAGSQSSGLTPAAAPG